MKKHKDLIIDTFTTGWHNYGQLVEKNRYAQSLPRSVAKLRQHIDTARRELSVGLIGTLRFKGKSYLWFESMRGQVKYFYLKEFEETEQQNLLNIVTPPFGCGYQNVG